MSDLRPPGGTSRNPVTDHLDLWTSALLVKSTAGRGSNGRLEAYGIRRLRELILELAVRGKLVPQDHRDEDAKVLLKKISSHLSEKHSAKNKNISDVSESEQLFALPRGWTWSRLGAIGTTNIGLTYSPKDVGEKGMPVLRSSNVQKGRIDLLDLVRVGCAVSPELLVSSGDLLICARNGSKALVGKTAMIHSLAEPMTFGAFMARYKSPLNPFVEVFLNSPLFRHNLDGVDTTTINQITQGNLISTIVPIPPLAEQHRIVAKVDELMALCDQLEQQQGRGIEAHQTLVETLLGTLTRVESAQEFAAAWGRIAEHFDTLFTTEHSIDQLKQAILQLAVMGKLVPQIPDDEPASALLEEISLKRSRLIKAGKIRKQRVLPKLSDGQKPFVLPKGWQWCALSQLGFFSGGKTPSKMKEFYWDGDIPWVTPKDMKALQISDTEDHVSEAAIRDGLELYEPESVLFVVRSGILRRTFPVAVSKVKCTVNQDLKVLSLFEKNLAPYVLLMMRGFEQYILKNFTKAGMTVESVLFDDFSSANFMLPPFAEQHRIIAKVDELMALCDALKARLSEAQTTQIHLADAIVERAVAAPEAASA